MSRSIPIALQSMLDQSVQTDCRCLRITLQDGRVFGVTTLDRDVVYDHGDGVGPVTYSASNGFDLSTIAADTSYSVTNAEAGILAAAEGFGITRDMVDTGQVDDAQWTCFVVDYDAPATGSGLILDAGDVGETRALKGELWVAELLSYSMRYRQPVGDVWQRPCRAIAGTPRDSADGLGCGWDVSGLWLDFEVTSVGAEANRTFTVTLSGSPAFELAPGRIEFETGDNTSTRLRDVLSYTGGVIELADSLAYLVEVGDTGRIRPDCAHTPDACKDRSNFVNYNGEDLIPAGDAVAGSAPGAQVPGWSGGGGGVTPETEAE